MNRNYYLIGVTPNSDAQNEIEKLIYQQQKAEIEGIDFLERMENIPDGNIPNIYWLQTDTEEDEQIRQIEVDQITYGRVVKDGNYGNYKLIIKAKPGDNVSGTLETLQRYVASKTKTKQTFFTLQNDIKRKEHELKTLIEATAEARQQWEATSEFLKAQGIKQDCAPFPSFNHKVLPESVDGEIVNLNSEF